MGFRRTWNADTGHRVRYPNMCEGIMKIFVETGPGVDECAEHRRIEVDLKAPGKFSEIFPFLFGAHKSGQGIAGSPLELSSSRVEIMADVGNGQMEKFTLLDLFHALNGKLKVLDERRYERDFEDVEWFFAKYPDEVRKFSDDLDEAGLYVFLNSLRGDKRASWGEVLRRVG